MFFDGQKGDNKYGIDPKTDKREILIFDKRFRSICFQIILFFIVIALFQWFVENAFENITARGDKFGFDLIYFEMAIMLAIVPPLKPPLAALT